MTTRGRNTAVAVLAISLLWSAGVRGNESIHWTTDATCQAIFSAVLEGLYTDGVSSEDAKLISNQENFVYACPLCDATRNALNVYLARPEFMHLKGRKDTFGKGLNVEVQEKLKSADRTVRLTAIGKLVQGWVEKRLTSMKLTPEEREDWRAKLAVRRKQGMLVLEKVSAQQIPGWKACAVCDACATAGGNNCERPAVMPFGELKPAVPKPAEKPATTKEKEQF